MKKKGDLISIVIPIYNGEKYISECLDSLTSQTYKNIEIIVVDDGSKDDTSKIIKQYTKSDERVIYLHQKNSGVSTARNNGISSAKGKYVTFVDSDDTVEKNYIEYLYSLIIDNNADISLTRYPRKFNKETNMYENNANNDIIELYDGLDAAKEMLYYKIVISSWNKMFNLQKLKENKILFNPNLSFGEGFDFVINAFLNGDKVAIGNAKIYNYRVDNQNSVMTKFSEKLVYGSMDSQDNIYKNINRIVKNSRKDELIKAWQYANWHTYCDCLNTIIGCEVDRQYKDLYKKIKKVCKNKALCVFNKNVPNKDKIKGIMYFFAPRFTSKTINKFRIRKYTKE